MKKIRKEEALRYHEVGRPGKIEVVPTVATKTQRDLSLAYSPGVAEPCLAIAENPTDVYRYTAKGNLVAVISNGTAVLGLGDIGPAASKPVMEGKGILFKIFADIDVFDLEVDAKDVDDFVRVVKALEPTFGGINLEDIAAPESFEIEARLKAETNIPVMHDDQHGTAIISSAALLNALELVGKKIEEVKIVTSGAGAAALSCVNLYVSLGVKKENIILTDRHGVVYTGREDMDPYKAKFAQDTDARSLDDVIDGADMFLGLSVGNVFNPAQLKRMAKNPIVFALANPIPEISYEEAIATRDDLIMATGRSDYPNQVNNVLGFPFIFRGALDVYSSNINEEMKVAAVHALADLTREPVPDIVNMAYGKTNIVFGKDYIIPKPLDPRLLTTVAPAVAKAAMDSGVARKPIKNWEGYKDELRARLGYDDKIMRVITRKAKSEPKKVVFAESDNYRILQAAQTVLDEGIAYPILLGRKAVIKSIAEQHGIDLEGMEIIDPSHRDCKEKVQHFGELLFAKRQRRGYNRYEAIKTMRSRNFFGCMMVETGEADALISGIQRKYADTIRPALQIIGVEEGVNKVAGMYIMLTKKGPYFFADTTVNTKPNQQDLIDITKLTARAVKKFNVTPKIAMLSYSNFGSFESEHTINIRNAVKYFHENHPEIIVDGEMQANFALNSELLKENYPFSPLTRSGANTLIFPNLTSGNIAYKMMQEVGGAEAIGPILMGLKKPVHVLQLGSSVREIVNMVTFAVVDAQNS
ncbi:MAG: NADP-dependent malic enzyme [Saprospiraceae bacterium]|nr:NADP-dependent malic enzyme [Saprospiraceae bacterium]